MTTTQAKYSTAVSSDLIQKYLERNNTPVYSSDTHPLLKPAFVLFVSSEGFNSLPRKSKERRTLQHRIFEEALIYDSFRETDMKESDEQGTFRAKEDYEQSHAVKKMIDSKYWDLSGKWVLKSVDLANPYNSSFSVYNLNNSDKAATRAEAARFIHDFEKAKGEGNLAVAYLVGGNNEYACLRSSKVTMQDAKKVMELIRKKIEGERAEARKELAKRALEEIFEPEEKELKTLEIIAA